MAASVAGIALVDIGSNFIAPGEGKAASVLAKGASREIIEATLKTGARDAVDATAREGVERAVAAGLRKPRLTVDPEGVVRETTPLPKPGEDLYVGTYRESRKGNLATGLNETHTPHHAAADVLTPVKTTEGATINLQKRLHELTRTYKRNPVRGTTADLAEQLHLDAENIRRILRSEGYDQAQVERALNELVRQNYSKYGIGRAAGQ